MPVDTPPPQIRNCCGRRSLKVLKRKEEDEDKGEEERDTACGIGVSQLGGDVKDECSLSLELSSIGSCQSTASSNVQPEPLSPGLVLLLAQSLCRFCLFCCDFFFFSLFCSYFQMTVGTLGFCYTTLHSLTVSLVNVLK